MLGKRNSNSRISSGHVAHEVSDDSLSDSRPNIVGSGNTSDASIFCGDKPPPTVGSGGDSSGEGGGRGAHPPFSSSSDKEEDYFHSNVNDGAVKDETLDTNTFDAIKVIGHGSFGCVFLAKVLETGETVAIKKVLQNRKFKNRELNIMKTIAAKKNHPFIITLKHYFLSSGRDKGDNNEGRNEIYLNLVLDYMPETLYSLTKQYAKKHAKMPLEHLRVYMYQLARALMHMHSLGVCHRDIKPQNLLVDPESFTLKLCDFGSSKILVKGEPNVAYICSRYYRAPELIFGSNDYGTIIDLWSYGCVMAEALMGAPVFPGNTGIDQLVEIIKVLGAPSKTDLQHMNPSYQEFKFPNIRAHNFESLFPAGTDKDAIDVVASVLKYMPQGRSTAAQLVMKPFFLDTFCDSKYTLPNGEVAPETFFEFTVEERTSADVSKLQLPERVVSASAGAECVGGGTLTPSTAVGTEPGSGGGRRALTSSANKKQKS